MIDDVRFLNPIYNSFALDFSTYWENATLMFVGNQSTVSIAGNSHTCDMVSTLNAVCSLICLMYFGTQYCKHYGPRSNCSTRSSLIWVHGICFHGKNILEYIWIYAAKAIELDDIFVKKIWQDRVIESRETNSKSNWSSHNFCSQSW